jgi:predicted nucleic acid-binding protein
LSFDAAAADAYVLIRARIKVIAAADGYIAATAARGLAMAARDYHPFRGLPANNLWTAA